MTTCLILMSAALLKPATTVTCDKPDGWIPLEAIWGKAVLIERGRREIRPSPRKGMILARVWHPAGWLYRRGLEIMIEIWHRLKRIAK